MDAPPSVQMPRTRSTRSRVLDRPPPPVEPAIGVGLAQVLLPALGGLGMVLFMIAGGNPLLLLAGLVMVVVTVGGAVGMVVSGHVGARRRLMTVRNRYLDHLDGVRAEARTEAHDRRTSDAEWHPDPTALFSQVLAHDPRLRCRDVVGFRVGTGPVPHPLRIVPVDAETDPVTTRAIAGLLASCRSLPGAPLLVECDTGPLWIVGPRHQAQDVIRTLLVQIVARRSSDEMSLTVLTDDPGAYRWARWLPHLATPSGGCRIMTPAPGAVPTASPPDGRPHLVVIDTDGDREVPTTPWTFVVGDVPDPGCRRLDVGPGLRIRLDGTTGTADVVTAPFAESFARALAARTTADSDDDPSAPLPAARVLGVRRLPDYRPTETPHLRTEQEFLTATIGRDAHGRDVVIDLKESARGGVGPHGVLVGATGSGKSELLRSLVLGLAARHHPDDVVFVLVDYKGGATFAGLEPLPHVAGVVTNLGDDLTLVDRVHQSLLGEIRRRQRVLSEAGHLPDIYAYRSWRRALGSPPTIEPLPHLVVVIDEFAELMTARSDIADLFTTVGRIGRSIGVHQLLASQRLDDGSLRGLEAFLSYRIALRTFTTEESRAVIGTGAAAELPPLPGCGFLRTTELVRFQAAYVSGPERVVSTPATTVEVVDWGPGQDVDESISRPPDDAPSLLDRAVELIRVSAPRARRVWTAPLPARITLADVRGAFGDPPPFVARIGIVDRPAEQRTTPLDVDLRHGWCHMVVLGGPDTGRSSTLRAVVHALAERHGPEELVVHAVDLDGDAHAALRHLPQVGSVAGRRDAHLTRRILHEVLREIDARSGATSTGRPHLVLLVDGYSTLRTDEDLHEQVTAVVTRGADVGVHVLLTAARWHDLRPALQSGIHARIELRLSDPSDTAVDRVAAAALPSGVPGRALVPPGRSAQIALPGDGVDEAGAYLRIAGRHSVGVSPVRLLPTDLPLADLLAAAPADPAIRWWIGLDEDGVRPVGLEHDTPHLIVLGDAGSGRTGLLAALLRQAADEPDTVVALVDPARTLAHAVPPSRLASYVTHAEDAAEVVASLVGELTSRRNALRGGSVVETSRIVLAVDDAELLGARTDVLSPLEPYLAHAHDLGLCLLVARHAGGAGRALYDPVLGRIKELGCPGVLLSGDPEEGPLWPGATMRPLPPGRAILARRGRGPRIVHVAHP